MSTPNFWAGYLKDGERVCRFCLGRIVKVEPGFAFRCRKHHTSATIRALLQEDAGQASRKKVVREEPRKEQERTLAWKGHAPDRPLTNHLGGVVFLPREVFERCIAEEAKMRAVSMLDDLFEQPNEVWELGSDGATPAWRYVRYYQEGAFFGMLDLSRLTYPQIVDWYFLEHDPNAPDAATRFAAIEAERTGKLIFSKFDGDTGEAYDPVPVLLDALTAGKDARAAFSAAHQVHLGWWARDATDREYSQEELMDMLGQRAFVLGAVATACVWNKEFAMADRIQPEFLFHAALWADTRREIVELYMVHLLFQEQYARLEAIFGNADFKAEFLDYHDLYRSALDPHYEFQSKQGPFLAALNKVNQYCRQIGRKPLFGTV
ncbi:MAG TPA: hypothetical protein PKD45_05010 [Flavobacteriales bacterium]|nr:hypothetical protein [Flavobacteriales bacterium]